MRFLYFGEALDSPHTWRQADTANYIHDFYENGIDLFHPSVCWLGGHKTLLLEFPLPEAIVAFAYQIFGESHVVGRAIFFLFFLGSLYFLFKIVDLLSGIKVARIASILYLLVPLSLFYSRAIHIDFTTIFLVHGAVYWLMLAYRKESYKFLIPAILLATLASVIKIPYLFYFVFPLVYFVIREKKLRFFLTTSFVYMVPVGVFMLWQHHVQQVNGSAPDWEFIPGYRKFNDNSHWYFGAFEQRLQGQHWQTIGERVLFEILGWSGLAFAMGGLIISILKKQWFYLFWLIGTLVYVLIFFNLNHVHNYYQLPLIPICVIFVAQGIHLLSDKIGKGGTVFVPLIVIGIGMESFLYAEHNYYQIKHDQIEIGEIIRDNTETDDLVMINYGNTDNKCPNYLYRARRNGWQLLDYGLNASILYQLMKEGGDYFITVRNNEIQGELHQFLKSFPKQEFTLKTINSKLYLYRLDVKQIWEGMPENERRQFENTGSIPPLVLPD